MGTILVAILRIGRMLVHLPPTPVAVQDLKASLTTGIFAHIVQMNSLWELLSVSVIILSGSGEHLICISRWEFKNCVSPIAPCSVIEAVLLAVNLQNKNKINKFK